MPDKEIAEFLDMQQTDNNNNTRPASLPGAYGTPQVQPPQQPQGQDAPTGSSGDTPGVIAARIILGIVCGLVLANTVRTIGFRIVSSLPSGSYLVDGWDGLFMLSTIYDIGMELVHAIPPAILLAYAVRGKAASGRAARIALVFWWALWAVGVAVYVALAHDAVTADMFMQLIVRHLISAVAPALSTACLLFIQRGTRNDGAHASRQDVPAETKAYGRSPRIVLGVVSGIVLAGCVLGVVALALSSLDSSQLAATGASGSEYMGTIVGGVVGLMLLVPAAPAILLMVFAARPTRSTYVAAIVALALWWALWVFAVGALLILSRTGIDAPELAAMFAGLFAIAIPPAVSTLCVWLASRDGRRDENITDKVQR